MALRRTSSYVKWCVNKLQHIMRCWHAIERWDSLIVRIVKSLVSMQGAYLQQL
jgi:hypothetical protein